jgi:Fe-S-cluster-containing dehydrogenase component
VREERRSRTTTLNQMRETRGGIHSYMSRLHARRASYKIMRSSVCHQCDTPGVKTVIPESADPSQTAQRRLVLVVSEVCAGGCGSRRFRERSARGAERVVG